MNSKMDAEPDRHSTSFTNPPHEDMTMDEIFDCSYPDCDYKSLWMENVRCHERGHNPTHQWNIPCQVCSQTYRSLVGFFHHMSSQHSNKFFCPWCIFLGEDLTDFKVHILAHSGTQPAFSSPSNVRKVPTFKAPMLKSSHRKTTIGTSKFCCGICFKSFCNGWSLSRHKKNVQCSSNPLANSEQELASTVDDTQEPLEDSEFGDPTAATDVTPVDEIRSERTADILIEKLKIDGQTWYECAICNHRSKWRHNLKYHLLVHTDYRPFGCPMKDCTYRSKSLKHLRKHSRFVHRVNLPAQKKAKIVEENLTSGTDCDNQTEVDVSSRNFSMVYACTWCDFIGDSELAALEHAQQHKTSTS